MDSLIQSEPALPVLPELLPVAQAVLRQAGELSRVWSITIAAYSFSLLSKAHLDMVSIRLNLLVPRLPLDRLPLESMQSRYNVLSIK